MNMKRFLLSILCCLLAVVSGYAEEATLSFADKAQRTSLSTASQTWEQNGVIFTNEKGSGNNVADYANPVRCYQNSIIKVECSLGNITKIVFTCGSSDYAGALKKSVDDYTVEQSGSTVTVTLDGTTNSLKIPKLSAQVRLNKIAVTYVVTGNSKPVTPTLTAGRNFVGSMKVEISCATEGAEIYYTTGDSEPTEAYTEPFEITETTTVKAIAVNEAGKSNVATATYTRVAASPIISFDDKATYTITPAQGTTARYTLNGKTPNENSDECPETLTLKADATLQVIAFDEDGYASPVVKEIFKLQTSDSSGSGSSAGTATLVTSDADIAVGDQVVIVASGYNYALSTTQNNNNRGQVAITKNGDNVTLEEGVQILTLEEGTTSGSFAFNTGSGYLYAASSGSNHLKTQTTNNANGSWSIVIAADGVATVKAKGSNARNMLQYNQTSSLFSCYASDKPQKPISLYKVNLATVEDYDLNVSSAGWATLYLGYNTVIPEDVTCYVISEVTAESATLTDVTGLLPANTGRLLPANTGVIVKAKEGTYTFEVTDESATVEKKLLEGTTQNQYIDGEAYVLGMVDGVVGLYKAEMAGGVFLNNANKAYLPVSALTASAQGAKALKFRFDDQTTGINGVATGKKPEVIFDLYGRKVNNATAPGLYIINGKKVMVK